MTPPTRRPRPIFSLHVDTARTWRGGQNQVLLTVMGLRARGHRTILVAHPDGELRRRASEGLELVPIASTTEMDLRAAWRLSRVLRRLGPDVVHAHDPHGVAMASLAVSIGPPEKRPLLVAARRVDFHVKRHAFSRWKYRQVDGFICASEAIRTMLIADGLPEERVFTVHEGIDVDAVAAIPQTSVHQEFWLPAQAPVVGNIAALVPHKGHRYLIDAARLVLREVPDARFVIVGQGELEATLRRQIKEQHLEKHVILAGFRPDVLSLLKGFDVFVLSSVSEGLGTSLLDAMACARPIVATEVGGIPEVVTADQTGLLVPPRDPRALAQALCRLLQDAALRARLAQRGATRVRQAFSAARMIDATLALYSRLGGTSHATGSVSSPAAVRTHRH